MSESGDEDNLFFDVMLWIPKFLFLIVVAFVLLAIINATHTQDLSSQKVQLEILIQSMYNSPDIFAYEDNLTKRTYPGVVDFKKFEKINFSNIMDTNTKRFLVKIELYNGTETEPISTKYYTSERDNKKETFETRLRTQNYQDRISEYVTDEKYVKILNYGDSDATGMLKFQAYIEQ